MRRTGAMRNRMGLRNVATALLICALGAVAPLLAPGVRSVWEVAVALGGLLLPLSWAVGSAVVIPALSTLFYGTPYLTTDLPLLVCQMIALAALANFFYDMVGWNVYGALLSAMGLSLVVLFCAASIFGAVSGGLVRALPYVRATLTAGWPRILLEIVLVPPAVLIVRRVQETLRT